ncbi:MAG: DUF3656 domain-containing protein [Peptococcaceae bacterium]|nr:DUF3656 domain-containing protein [Peptococcaceae bacterium]
METVKVPELLAPAGGWDALVAAVQNGADAVYLGVKSFNARQSADNFDRDLLVKAIDYAHIRDVKVYVTMNILLADAELEEAVCLARFLYEAGADGLIVQDLGFAKLVKELLPGFPLHASTQMTVHNLTTLRFLKELGFERVILARELSLKEIDRLKQECNLELEVFVHGALCVCYSGQCLMSSLIGGRSGNRGRCAQPCRLPYILMEGEKEIGAEGPYLLSPRDLNLSSCIGDIAETGVDALKIEGRLRRPEYVATVVSIYRRILDRGRKGRYYITPEEQRDLAQIFNRRFSKGYFYGNPGRDLMNYTQPNNRGLFVGRVRRYDARSKTALVALDEELCVGDGVDFWVSVGGRVSLEIKELLVEKKPVKCAPAGSKAVIPVEGPIRAGDRVFKIWDAGLLRKARGSFASEKEAIAIPLRIDVRAAVGEPLTVRVKDFNGHTGEAATEVLGQEALKHPLTAEVIERQLSRLGNTPFHLQELNCDIRGNVMIPLSALNEARRQALKQLMNQKAAEKRRRLKPYEEFRQDWQNIWARVSANQPVRAAKPELVVAVGTLESLKAALRAGADTVCFPGEGLGPQKPVGLDEVGDALRLCDLAGAKFVFWIPRIVRNHEITRWLRFLEEYKKDIDTVMTGNLGILGMLAKTGLQVYADYPLNIFNRVTAASLKRIGIKRMTLSPELTLAQVRELSRSVACDFEILVQGSLPMMVSEYCVIGSVRGGRNTRQRCRGPCREHRFYLKDRKRVLFPVAVDRDCRMHIFNAKDLCMVEHLSALKDLPLAGWRIDLRLKDASYAAAVIGIYREALDIVYEDPSVFEAKAAKYKKHLESLSPSGVTKGHYFRGVL